MNLIEESKPQLIKTVKKINLNKKHKLNLVVDPEVKPDSLLHVMSNTMLLLSISGDPAFIFQ
jgi:hypothetical protein